MAKRRVKKRTQGPAKGAAAGPGNAASAPGQRVPKSMVIRMGASDVGPSVTQLVRDVRKMMEPQTAARLQERRSNRLRDYTTMAGPLGVTHLLLFSRSSSGNTNLRLALTPRGPTFHFRVEKYSLCKDVHKAMKRPKSGGTEYLAAPLLVMNNFTSQATSEDDKSKPKIPKHLESLATTVFQSLFPPINPTATPLNGIKRVLLLDRVPQSALENEDNDGANYILNMRHYAIETRTARSVPKPLRRLDAAEKLTHAGTKRKRGGLPNLGKLNDVSDYLLDPHAADGFTSGSDSEPETDAEVEVLARLSQKVNRTRAKPSKSTNGNAEDDDAPNVERKGIKLHELGPRLRLRLTKVEEGLCGGKVMWHEYIHKTPEELRKMDSMHEKRRAEKERRKAEQKANVERKRAERKSRGGGGKDAEDDDEGVEEGMEDWSDDEWDDYTNRGEDDDDEMEE
ncbi:Hypothetical protein R9X50_00580500 [Acrodontium crateriforme]|uniref:Brix domain-containing protein n=1 Tax=Acrodontium crateriforme TaxID=150365 RepID=A0AAQ3M7W1_9PEZI|nr:Hypothetical protein R9X50_00580500 [Acrodontium crateriforme]